MTCVGAQCWLESLDIICRSSLSVWGHFYVHRASTNASGDEVEIAAKSMLFISWSGITACTFHLCDTKMTAFMSFMTLTTELVINLASR
jgi:hypothetical protein